MVDNTDRVVQVNKGFETLFGYRAEEAKGQFINELIIPKDRIEEASVLSRVALNGKAVRKETVRKRKDGSLVDVSAVGYPIHFGDKLVGVYVIYSDITERKRAELEYKTIIQTTIDGFWLVDMQGRFLDVNDAYCQLIGYSRDELLKMSIPDIEAIEKPEETAARIAKITKVGGDRFETHHRCKDGRIVDVEVSVDYLGVGGTGSMFVFIRDISERKQAEEALKDSRRRFRDMVNLLPQSVWEIDTEGRSPSSTARESCLLGTA